MSSESLAAFRKHFGDDLGNLAEEHFKHDLQESDREKLLSASKSFGTWATVGSILGLGLGVILAHRIRTNRLKYFNAFRAVEKPTHIQFANGRTGKILFQQLFSCIQIVILAILDILEANPDEDVLYNVSNDLVNLYPCRHVEPIPDVTPLLKPTTLGDFATYTFFATGGLFLFGELGGLAGSISASRTISRDPEAKRRIENAFRRFRADTLRKQAEKLEQGTEPLGW